MAHPTYKLSYFNIRGLAEQARLLMVDNGIPFTDDAFKPENWPQIKPTMVFGQVPCLMDGENAICQTGAIMRHLARKHGLYGSNENEMAHADMAYDGVRDVHTKYTEIIYRNYDGKGEFVEKTLPVLLAPFEKMLTSKSGGKGLLLGGGKPCFADYVLFEELMILLRMSAKCLDNFPNLKEFHDTMAARPNLAPYLNSDAFKTKQINGNKNE